MKKLLLVLVLAPLAASGAMQDDIQTTLSDTLKLKEFVVQGEEVDRYHMEGFVFRDFTMGEVLYKTGAKVRAMLNYDAVYHCMYFIDANGKYLILGDIDKISMVAIGKRKFVPVKDQAFAELLAYSSGNVLKEHKALFATREVKSAYGAGDQTTATQNLKDMSHTYSDEGGSLGRLFWRTSNIDLGDRNPNQVTVDRSVYYVYDAKGKIIPVVSLKPLYKIFGHEEEIKEYVKSNKLNIKNSDDFLKIMDYCQSLENATK